MAIFDFLFGSKNPPPVTTTEGMSIPKYIAEPSADIIGEAMDVAKEGYQAYQDPRIAGFNQAEKDEAKRQEALNTFMANQPAPVDLNQGNPGFISPQQTPGTNGTAPANPVFNQNAFNTMSAVADPTQDTYGSLFT